MRPNYGIDLVGLLGDAINPPFRATLQRRVSDALAGLPISARVATFVQTGDHINMEITFT